MDIPKQISGMDIEVLKRDEKCPNCGSNQYYHHDYDALFCLKENIWLETGCDNPKCEYCGDRPNKPI